jgi:hypothetical protein
VIYSLAESSLRRNLPLRLATVGAISRCPGGILFNFLQKSTNPVALGQIPAGHKFPSAAFAGTFFPDCHFICFLCASLIIHRSI